LKGEKLPFKRAAIAILAATAIISGGAAFSLLYYSHIQESQKQDPAFYLRILEQKGGLPQNYIEELLGLCVDQPINLLEFDSGEARKHLLNSPVIKSAEVKTSLPNACHVVYSLYEPVAILADWDNAALDRGGRIIPWRPFFSKDKLPLLAIGGAQDVKWGDKLKLQRVELALKLLRSLPLDKISLIDVSRVELPSFGQRELIVTLGKAIVRLNPDEWESGWRNFQKVEGLVNQKQLSVIDLRISKLGYLSM
jgi:cell division septal protein FtsQ